MKNSCKNNPENCSSKWCRPFSNHLLLCLWFQPHIILHTQIWSAHKHLCPAFKSDTAGSHFPCKIAVNVYLTSIRPHLLPHILTCLHSLTDYSLCPTCSGNFACWLSPLQLHHKSDAKNINADIINSISSSWAMANWWNSVLPEATGGLSFVFLNKWGKKQI